MTEKEIRVLRKGTCPSLSGRSTLSYEFGHDGKSILFHIADNSGSGHFNSEWIPLNAILDLLHETKGPFSLSIFKSLYPGRSINSIGFLGAALKKEGLIVIEKRKYLMKDTKAFLADLGKLAKAPAKKSPAKKIAKPEQKEEQKQEDQK